MLSAKHIVQWPYQRGRLLQLLHLVHTRCSGVTIAYVRVQCYSGTKANERPVRFELNGHEYMVEEIIDQWYGPEDTFFKLRTGDNNIYILRYSPGPDLWSLESFRKS
jgi:hypothetical protein